MEAHVEWHNLSLDDTPVGAVVHVDAPKMELPQNWGTSPSIFQAIELLLKMRLGYSQAQQDPRFLGAGLLDLVFSPLAAG
jgi:hypothetical protein